MNDPPVDGVCKIINLGKAESGDPSNPGLNTALLDIFHIKVLVWKWKVFCLNKIKTTVYFQCQNWRDPNQHALTK